MSTPTPPSDSCGNETSVAVASTSQEQDAEPLVEDDAPIPLAQLDADILAEEKRMNEILITDASSVDAVHGGDTDQVAAPNPAEQPVGIRGPPSVVDAVVEAVGDTPPSSAAATSCTFNEQRTRPSTSSSVQYQRENSSTRVVRNFFRGSNSGNTNGREVLIQATLVDQEASTVQAEPMMRSFIERKWKIFALLVCIILSVLAVVLSLSLTRIIHGGEDEDATTALGILREEDAEDDEKEIEGEFQPSLPPFSHSPSSSPTVGADPRPTLEIVQERGWVNCGLRSSVIANKKGFLIDLVRARSATGFCLV